MTNPLSFTGKLTLQDALDLHHYRMLFVIRRPIRWLMAIFSFFIAALCIFAASNVGLNAGLVLILAFCFYFPFGWFLTDRLSVSRRYRRHPEQFIESTVSFTRDSVAVSNANMDLRLDWNQVRSIVVTPRGILFFVPPFQALCWLPRRLFDGNTHREAILKLADEHSIPTKTMA